MSIHDPFAPHYPATPRRKKTETEEVVNLPAPQEEVPAEEETPAVEAETEPEKKTPMKRAAKKTAVKRAGSFGAASRS